MICTHPEQDWIYLIHSIWACGLKCGPLNTCTRVGCGLPTGCLNRDINHVEKPKLLHYCCPAIYNQCMKQLLDRFILQLSYSLLKKVLYVYVGAVIFRDSAPVASIVLWILILITLLSIGYQSAIRKSNIIKAHSSDGKAYVETMRAPFQYWGLRLLVALTGGALTGYLLAGRFGLSGIDIFLLILGYPLFYRDANLFGAYVAYLVTDCGIGIEFIPGHLVYQTFIGFDEIKSINIIENKKPALTWSLLTPREEERNGLLLIPSNPNGFSPRDQEFLITPKNVPAFLSHLPPSVKVIRP